MQEHDYYVTTQNKFGVLYIRTMMLSDDAGNDDDKRRLK